VGVCLLWGTSRKGKQRILGAVFLTAISALAGVGRDAAVLGREGARVAHKHGGERSSKKLREGVEVNSSSSQKKLRTGK